MTADLFRRALLGATFAFAAGAQAQTPAPASPSPPTFALLSLVGDQFSVVLQRDKTGTNLDPNDRRSYPIDTALLDDTAMGAAEDVLKRLKPVSPVLRFSIRDPRLFALQDGLLADSAESHGLRAALAKLLRENQATRLVLVTKWRDAARFRLRNEITGNGRISGLGFYVDQLMVLEDVETGRRTEGFLGPFAYVRVTVIDAATMAPIRSEEVRESEMNYPAEAKGAVRAWDALTAAGKVDALERVLRRAVESGTTAALAD